MRIRILSSTVMILILSCSSVLSQTDQVHKMSFDTLRTGDVQATLIGVDDMRYVGNTYIHRDDSTVMQYITRVVQRDVDFYADFELVKIDSFYLKTYEITELDLLGWERLGAEYVVKLEAEFPGSNIRVRWKVFYATSRREAAKGSFERKKSQWRTLAHDIGNDLGVGGSLDALRRTGSGPLSIDRVHSMEEILACDKESLAEKMILLTDMIKG